MLDEETFFTAFHEAVADALVLISKEPGFTNIPFKQLLDIITVNNSGLDIDKLHAIVRACINDTVDCYCGEEEAESNKNEIWDCFMEDYDILTFDRLMSYIIPQLSDEKAVLELM